MPKPHRQPKLSCPCQIATDNKLPIGIVQGKGNVKQVHQRNDFSSIQIEFPRGKTDAIQTGASVAINGTCLTVCALTPAALAFCQDRLCLADLGTSVKGDNGLCMLGHEPKP